MCSKTDSLVSYTFSAFSSLMTQCNCEGVWVQLHVFLPFSYKGKKHLCLLICFPGSKKGVFFFFFVFFFAVERMCS